MAFFGLVWKAGDSFYLFRVLGPPDAASAYFKINTKIILKSRSTYINIILHPDHLNYVHFTSRSSIGLLTLIRFLRLTCV
jgi:hypothetical protein